MSELPKTAVRSSSAGFSLIELLVTIAIIAILSVVGIAVYSGVMTSVNDAKRKGDLQAIYQAYETNKSATGAFQPLADTQFAGGTVPKTPEGRYYSCLFGPDNDPSKIRCNTVDDTKVAYGVSLGSGGSGGCSSISSSCFIVASSTGDTFASPFYPSGNPACDSYAALVSGLVGYWKMDETLWNGTIAEVKDSTVNANNGTALTGAVIITPAHAQIFPQDVSSLFLNAGSFDGIGYINAGRPSSLDIIGNQLSISVWIKPDTPANWGGVLSKGQPSLNVGYAIGFRSDANKNALTFAVRTASGYRETKDFNFVPTQNIWYHVVAVYNGLTVKLYKNGNTTPVATENITGNLLSSAAWDLLIGANTPMQRFKGLIDDLRIYNRVLSGAEVSALYNGGNGCL